MNTIQEIQENSVYKEIMRDSFGGVMYNVANRNKYDSAEIVTLWNSLSESEKNSAGGIIKGAMHFLTEEN